MIDIKHLEKTVSHTRKNREDSMWQEAFKEYNETNKTYLGMGCPPCYYKVLKFHLAKQEKYHHENKYLQLRNQEAEA